LLAAMQLGGFNGSRGGNAQMQPGGMGMGQGQRNPNWHMVQNPIGPVFNAPPPMDPMMMQNMQPPMVFKVRCMSEDVDGERYITLDEDGWCQLANNIRDATNFLEQVNVMGKVYYQVMDGEWDGHFLSVSSSSYLGAYRHASDSAHWYFDNSGSMICVNGESSGQAVTFKDEDDGYLYCWENYKPCMIMKEMGIPGGYGPPPPPIYQAYKSPYQAVGFEVNQMADNMFAQGAAVDFRSAEHGFPYASRSLAVKPSSAHRPPPVHDCPQAMLPFMAPCYRFAGQAPSSGYGPLGLALENASQRGYDDMRPMHMIVGLEHFGAAERAGGRIGDCITDINRMPLQRDSAPTLQAASKAYESGTPINITVLRGNKIEHLYLTPPAHVNRPKGIGAMAGPNPPEPFQYILQQWYNTPPNHAAEQRR